MILAMDPGRPASQRAGGFQVTSTSSRSATVSPLVLRQTDTVRLVLKPVLVRNNEQREAAVDGALCYQRKRRNDEWEDVEAIPLSTLRAGEGVKLDLRSAEMLTLYRGLKVLYETVERDGVPTGTHTYIQANPGTVLADVAALLNEGGARQLLETFVRWARESQADLVAELGALDPDTLVNFDAAIGVARITRFLAEARGNLANDDESYWQALLMREAWVISQLYSTPMVIFENQAYVGGKSIDNRGGSVVDYMYANALTQNSLIVELKTPAAPIVRSTTYRNRVYGPSNELAGATQQLLHSRHTLQEQYIALASGGRTGFHIFGTRALLIIGCLPREEDRIRSFETYRNAQRGIEIVTFDEMLRPYEVTG